MDPNSGRLIASKHPDFQKLMEGEDFEEVPEELNQAAKAKLKGENEAYVSKTSGGKLSKWAAQQRKEKRLAEKKQKAGLLKRERLQRKHRRKKVKSARRKNR